MKTLRSVDILKSLTIGQLQRLEDLLTEVTVKEVPPSPSPSPSPSPPPHPHPHPPTFTLTSMTSPR
jgi:hypothetical protein